MIVIMAPLFDGLNKLAKTVISWRCVRNAFKRVHNYFWCICEPSFAARQQMLHDTAKHWKKEAEAASGGREREKKLESPSSSLHLSWRPQQAAWVVVALLSHILHPCVCRVVSTSSGREKDHHHQGRRLRRSSAATDVVVALKLALLTYLFVEAP